MQLTAVFQTYIVTCLTKPSEDITSDKSQHPSFPSALDSFKKQMSIKYFKGIGIYKLKVVILPVIEELVEMLNFL